MYIFSDLFIHRLVIGLALLPLFSVTVSSFSGLSVFRSGRTPDCVFEFQIDNIFWMRRVKQSSVQQLRVRFMVCLYCTPVRPLDMLKWRLTILFTDFRIKSGAENLCYILKVIVVETGNLVVDFLAQLFRP